MSKCSVKEAVSKIKSVLETKGLSDAGKKVADSRVNAIAAVLVEMQKFKNEHALGRENKEQTIEQANMSKSGISRDKDITDKNLYKAKSNESYDKMAGYMDISPTEMTLSKECK
jgi:hypothetical protein